MIQLTPAQRQALQTAYTQLDIAMMINQREQTCCNRSELKRLAEKYEELRVAHAEIRSMLSQSAGASPQTWTAGMRAALQSGNDPKSHPRKGQGKR